MTSPETDSPEALTLRRYNRALIAIVSVIFAITFLKGFRLPNLWSATQFSFNYSQGYVRRGLIGEIARQLFGDNVFRYHYWANFSVALLIAVAVALALCIRKSWQPAFRDIGFKCVVLAFAASPGLVVFVHLVGYYDYFGLLAVLVLLLWSSRVRNRYAIYYAVAGIGLLFAFIHEVLAPMFGPVLLFAMLCHTAKRIAHGDVKRWTQAILLVHVLGVTVLVFVLSSVVSTLGTQDAHRIEALKAWVIGHANYPPRHDAFEALQRSSAENMTKLMPEYWAVREFRAMAARSFVAMLPSFAFVVYYGLREIRRLALPLLHRSVLGATFALAAITPLGLYFVGWDWNRWNAIALLAAFAGVLALKLYFDGEADQRPVPPHVWALGAVAVALSLASDTILFDGVPVKFFPFTQQLAYLWELLTEGIRRLPGS